MDSTTRSPSLPVPQARRFSGKRRRIPDSSDTEEHDDVKRARSVALASTTENELPPVSIHTIPKLEDADNEVKSTRDRKKRRKKKRKVSIVQEHQPVVKIESDSQVASGSGHHRSPSSVPARETPIVALGLPQVVGPQPQRVKLEDSESSHALNASNYFTERHVKVEPEDELPLSSGDKGKGVADCDPSPPAIAPVIPDSSAGPSASQETKSLAAELDAHKTMLNSLLPPLTCQICLFLMHRPFALAPCGHTACHSCLVSWFSSNPAQEGQVQVPPPTLNGPAPANHVNPEGENPQPPPPVNFAVMRRKKTCPHCRAVVRDRPAEVWAMKDIILNIVKSGLVDGELVPPALGQEAVTGEEARGDPWANIFPPTRAHIPDPFIADLANMDERELMGVLDVEDGGVYRCIDCTHEIEDGVCTGCDRVYPGHDAVGGWGTGSDMDSEVDFLPFGHPHAQWSDDTGSDAGNPYMDAVWARFGNLLDVGGDTEVEDEEDDGDYEGSENSFIATDDETGPVVGDEPRLGGRWYRGRRPASVSVSSGSSGEDHHSVNGSAREGTRTPTLRGGVRFVESVEDLDEDTYHGDLAQERAALEREMYGDDGSVPTRLSRYNQPYELVTDDDGESYDPRSTYADYGSDDSAEVRPSQPRGSRMRYVVSSDEEEEVW